MPDDGERIFTYEQHWATGYDARMQVVVPGYDLMHETVASHLRARLNPGSSILVIGAGTGADIITLCAYDSGWKITGVDPSAEMLEIARQKIAAARPSADVRIECCGIEDFEDDPLYDVAILSLVLQLYPDDGSKLKLLQTAARHLKPDGLLVLVDSYGDYGSPEFERTLEALKEQTIRRGFNTEEAEKDIESVRARFHLVPEQRIQSLLSRAGFGPAEIIFHAFITGVWLARSSAA